MVLQPIYWKSEFERLEDYEFDRKLLLTEDIYEVDGEYTKDLDLFFKSEDVRNLFNYIEQDYKEVCALALDLLKEQAKENEDYTKIQELNVELYDIEWNYLSEDTNIRDTLYHVCILNKELSHDDALILHESEEKF